MWFCFRLLKCFFFSLPHLATYIFFSTNEPELGAGIDPGMALNVDHLHLVLWIRRDLNPQPLHRESSLLTTRPDFFAYFNILLFYFST